MRSGKFQQVVDRACSTEPISEIVRKDACDEIVAAINERRLTVLDLAVLLAGPLTSPEKDARESGTRLLGEVVGRCRPVLGAGELHTLAEFLSARLRDWPCVGAAAVACRVLLQPPLPPLPSSSSTGGGSGAGGGGGGELRDDSVLLVLEATAEMLRSAQSFRQDDRSALLRLLLACSRGRWGRLAAAGAGAAAGGPQHEPQLQQEPAGGGGGGQRRGVALLDSFLGAVDGEKDPRCLMLAFEAVRALCEMHHAPGADAAPLRELADEVVDWASAYFPVSFNPPPSSATSPSGPSPPTPALTRANLAASLECALAASPFLAGGVLPLLGEKLSSTYRPAKEDALSALRRCCPAFGQDALAPHTGQLWPALRAEIMAPCGFGGGGGVGGTVTAGAGPGGGGGSDSDPRGLALAAAAAGCLTVVVRAAGPGEMDALALQDAVVGDLVAVVRGAASSWASSAPASSAWGPTSRVSGSASSRADGQVLCGSMLLAAIAAAGPAALRRAHTVALAPVQTALAESLAPPPPTTTTPAAAAEVYNSRADGTLYGMTVLTAAMDAVATELRLAAGGGGKRDDDDAAAARAWLAPNAPDGFAALTEVRSSLLAALMAVHSRINRDDVIELFAAAFDMAVDGPPSPAVLPPSPLSQLPLPGQPKRDYSPAAAAELRLAAVSAWGSLLQLHEAAVEAVAAAAAADRGVAATALQPLTLSAAELAVAAEQLCACALAVGSANAGGAADAGSAAAAAAHSRMRWGQPVDGAQEAAAALQLLIVAAASPQRPSAEGGADAELAVEGVVQLLVDRLAAAMAGGSGDVAGSLSARAAALRLAVQLSAAPEVQQPQAAATARATGDEGCGAGATAFAAALLEVLRKLLLRRGGSVEDEEWLLDCLTQLSTRVLPPLAALSCAAAGPAAAAAAAAPTSPQPSQKASTASTAAAVAVAAAAHRLASGALRAAAEWEAEWAAAAGGIGSGGGGGDGGAGLPFRGGAGGGRAGEAAGGACSPLVAAWCGAVQQLTACCDDRQQLDLAMEAAERIAAAAAACGGSGAGAGAGTGACLATANLSCAVVAGLRSGLLAPHSTQALADSLLRLLAPAAKEPLRTPPSPPFAAAAAVALAAAVNRWQDAPSLDTWLASTFRPALLQRMTQAEANLLPSPLSLAAAPAMVRAVGWVGRALALRNHIALGQVLQALTACLRTEVEAAQPNTAQTAVSAGPTGDNVRVGGATIAATTTTGRDVDASSAGGRAGPGAVPEPGGGAGTAASGAAAPADATAAAAEAFGVLVADLAEADGVALAARPPQAVCRVLWQQRTYSLCAQALDAEFRRHLEQQQQRDQQPQPQQRPDPALVAQGPAPGSRAAQRLPPLQTAVAVARLAASAPRPVCRSDAPRLAPLLLRSAQALCASLRCGGGGGQVQETPAVAAAALTAAAAAAVATALHGALEVLRDWLGGGGPEALPSEQLKKVLRDHVEELVVCVCAAAEVGAVQAPGRAGPRAAHPATPATAAAAHDQRPAPMDPRLAAAVREEALRCCLGLMDALPYHVLHPLRHQVLSCVVQALDDNRRSVRQLAVRARRAWGDT